ncbi:MAG: hypothetical protein QG657_131 [Acidobacteriota bacterium]|nr:hypothetical protein [Acidobacteriota bacterium]
MRVGVAMTQSQPNFHYFLSQSQGNFTLISAQSQPNFKKSCHKVKVNGINKIFLVYPLFFHNSY